MKAFKNIPLVVSTLALGVLVVISGAGVVFAFRIGGIDKITVHGWVALGLGVVLTGGLAATLIWLAFYSASHGYDDR